MYRLILLIPIAMVKSAHISRQCSSMVCSKSARFMAESLDLDTSPCDDFYQFACGGWLKRHDQIPATKPSYSVTIDVQDQMIAMINVSLQSNETTKHPSRTIRLAKFLYDQCLSIDQLTVTEQSHLAESLFISGHHHKLRERPWYEIYTSNMASIHSLFRIVVIDNPRNTSQMILAIDTVPFPLGDAIQSYGQESPTLVSYRHFLGNISRLIPYLRNETESKIVKLVDEMIEIELRLSSAKMNELERQDLSKIINVMSIDRFEMETKFKWLHRIFRPMFRMFNVDIELISLKDSILVTDVNYFRRFNRLIETIPGDRLRTFMDFQIARMVTPYLGEQYRRHLFEFLKSKSGVRRTPDRWRTCYSQIEKLLPWALSRLYVDGKHFGEDDLSAANKLVDSIHEEFIQMVDDQRASWIEDDDVRRISVEKLKHIAKNVAYPPWILDDHRLDALHHLPNHADYQSIADYIPSIIHFEWNQLRANFQQLTNTPSRNKSKNIDSWAMEPATINAAYSPIENTITIPAAILTVPYFDSKLPLSMNYGAIGTVIGHELTHSLDDDGLHFDHKGNYHWRSIDTRENEFDDDNHDQLWSPELLESFEKRYRCLIDQYSNITEPITGLQLNGNNTLGENIADNGGLQQAYQAFRTQQHKNPEQANRKLAHLPQFEPEQLFFIAYSQVWCTAHRLQSLWAKIHHDPHVPARYRVNVPASNSLAFAEAFACSLGSAMNPRNKCIIW